MKTKPVHEIRLGSMKVAIWKNDANAAVRYSTSFSRFYKNGDKWESSESFGRDALLLLAKWQTKRTLGFVTSLKNREQPNNPGRMQQENVAIKLNSLHPFTSLGKPEKKRKPRRWWAGRGSGQSPVD